MNRRMSAFLLRSLVLVWVSGNLCLQSIFLQLILFLQWLEPLTGIKPLCVFWRSRVQSSFFGRSGHFQQELAILVAYEIWYAIPIIAKTLVVSLYCNPFFFLPLNRGLLCWVRWITQREMSVLENNLLQNVRSAAGETKWQQPVLDRII